MDENTKRRFDAIGELWKRSWQRITERRSYEWRVAFTLWTALTAFIGLVVTNELTASGRDLGQAFVWAVTAIGFVVCCLHGLYLRGVGEAHDTDRQIAIHYERILQDLTESGFDKSLNHGMFREATLGNSSPKSQFRFLPVIRGKMPGKRSENRN